jgi:GDP-4-dehydro-6-deoxy-D-mannose reductase
MKKVLIFGVAGFVGSYLVKEFLEHGYQVFGSDKVEKFSLGEFFDYKKGDLLIADVVKDIVQEVTPDIVINLAAVSSVGQSWAIPQMTMSVNVIGALNVLEAARACKDMPKVMFIGSSEEYASSDKPIDEKSPLDANNPYGISKMAQERFAELYCHRYGMKIYCVRSFNHTGIGQREGFAIPSFCKQVADIERSGQAGVIKVGNLEAKRDFSNVKDIVRAYRMIVESAECAKIYNVGSGKAYSLKELLEYIISLSTQKITVMEEPERFRPVDTQKICCNHSLISADLGWQPEYSIFETVRDIYEELVKF